MADQSRPKVAVFKFSSCDGCQLAMLSLEDELLQLASKIDFAYFLEATSRTAEGPYDVTFVEGSITTPHDVERIREIRADSKYLVAIGACSIAGGIQALRNWSKIDSFIEAVYASPEFITTLEKSTPISDYVQVDFQLNGCPVNKLQLLEVTASLLRGRAPHVPAHSVCIDCKQKGIPCVMVTQDIPCLGPLTHAGCGALCPAFERGCYGCYGPSEMSRPETLAEHLRYRCGTPELIRKMRGINAWAQPFRNASDKLERPS